MYVVAQFYPLVKFYFSCLGIVMYDNEFETKKNKIQTKNEINIFHRIPKMEKSKKTSLQGVYFLLFSRCIAMKHSA